MRDGLLRRLIVESLRFLLIMMVCLGFFFTFAMIAFLCFGDESIHNPALLIITIMSIMATVGLFVGISKAVKTDTSSEEGND